MKTAICTLHDDNFKPFMPAVVGSLYELASMNKMELVSFNSLLDSNLHPSWNKLLAVKRCFHLGYDAVLWVDADSRAVHGEGIGELHDYLNGCGDLVLNSDENGICMSHFFMRVTDYNRRLLAALLTLGDVRDPSVFGIGPKWEQNAFKALALHFNIPHSIFPHGFVVPVATHPQWINQGTMFYHFPSMSIEERCRWINRV